MTKWSLRSNRLQRKFASDPLTPIRQELCPSFASILKLYLKTVRGSLLPLNFSRDDGFYITKRLNPFFQKSS